VIEGTVNAGREPVISIWIRDDNGREHEYAAIVDTGFTGWLTLPLQIIQHLRLIWREFGEAVLADGSEVDFDVYEATVLSDGELVRIRGDESDSEPLVGMELMDGFSIFIEDTDGGAVEIERM